ncbi:MAG: hypothetical protein ABI761_07820 [Saprospiraceae bacterium]
MKIRARDSHHWQEENITKEQFITLLKDKIASVSFNRFREDIVRFIRDDKVIDIWSAEYFNDLIEKIKFI